MKSSTLAPSKRPSATAKKPSAKGKSASKRATATAKRGEPLTAKSPAERSPKQENL